MNHSLLDQEEKNHSSTIHSDSLNVPAFVALLLFTVGDNFYLALYDGIYNVPNFLYAHWVEALVGGALLLSSAIAIDVLRMERIMIIAGCSLFILSGIAALATETLNGTPLFFSEKIGRGFIYFGLLTVLLRGTPFMGFVQKTVLLSYIGANCLTHLINTIMYIGFSDEKKIIVTMYGIGFFIAIIVLIAVAKINEHQKQKPVEWIYSNNTIMLKQVLPYLLACILLYWVQKLPFQYINATYALGHDNYTLNFTNVVIGFGLVALLHFAIHNKNPWFDVLIVFLYIICITGLILLVGSQTNQAVHAFVHSLCYSSYYLVTYAVFKLALQHTNSPIISSILALIAFASNISYVIPKVELGITMIQPFSNY